MRIDKEFQEKQQQIVLDVWQLHILEAMVFLNLFSHHCSLKPVVSGVIDTCEALLILLFITRLIMLWKGKIKPRYEPHQIIVTGFIILFNALVRLFVDWSDVFSKFALGFALLAFASYFFRILWKGEIKKDKES